MTEATAGVLVVLIIACLCAFALWLEHKDNQ
jgi:hypothetical protein